MEEKLKISHRSKEEIALVDLIGQLDAHTAPLLESYLQTLISDKVYKIVINFRGLEYISSAGLGVFMSFIEEVRAGNGDIKLCEMQSKIYKIFDLLGFPLLYEITEKEEEAIASFLDLNKSKEINEQ